VFVTVAAESHWVPFTVLYPNPHLRSVLDVFLASPAARNPPLAPSVLPSARPEELGSPTDPGVTVRPDLKKRKHISGLAIPVLLASSQDETRNKSAEKQVVTDLQDNALLGLPRCSPSITADGIPVFSSRFCLFPHLPWNHKVFEVGPIVS